MGQYVDEFSKLACYAPDVATDATKQEKFLEGLNDELSMQLMVANLNNYQELVDRALMIEGKQQQIDNRKRKYGQGKYNLGAQQRPHFTPNSGGHIHHNHGGHNASGGSSHNNSGPKNGNGNGGRSSQNRSNPATPAKRYLSHITCFKCQKTGHYATECPEAKNGNGNGSSRKKPNLFTRGQVNHVSVEEVEEQPDAVIRSFWLSNLPLSFFLILVHRIHTYQGDSWISISCQPKPLGHPC